MPWASSPHSWLRKNFKMRVRDVGTPLLAMINLKVPAVFARKCATCSDEIRLAAL